jgi:hypothetical protein
MFGLGGPGYKAGLGAANTASSVGAGYGSQAAGINSNLLPFLTRELQNPEGYSQQQQGAMLNQAEAGAGGATAGLNTEANLAMARNRNSGGFSGALDDAAREKDKALAGTSEGIAANNAQLQEQQKQSAASGLQGLEGMDTNAQLKAMGLVSDDINAASNAYGKGDWMSGLNSITSGIGNFGKLASGFKIPGFGGFTEKGSY